MLRQMNHASEALDRRRENVSDAPLGLNELRHAWILFQLAAKAKDLHVNAAIEDVFMDSSRLQKMLAAERTLGSVEEGDEQRIFAFCQHDLNAVGVGEAPRAEVQSPTRKLVASAFVVAGRGRAPPVEPSQHRAHSSQKLPQVERFRHVVVSAELEADDAVDLVAAVTRRDDDRHVAMRSNLPQQVEAVLEAEPKIQDHHVDLVGSELIDHLLTAGGQQCPDVIVDEVV